MDLTLGDNLSPWLIAPFAGLYAAGQADEPERLAPTAREVVLLTTR